MTLGSLFDGIGWVIKRIVEHENGNKAMDHCDAYKNNQ